MLVEHLGGSPTIVQRALIGRAARMALHLKLWDERSLPNGGAVSATGHNHYIQWANSLTRLLCRIGIESAKAPPITLEQHLANLAAHHRDEEAAA
jgi:hypothetical protein